MRRCGAVVLVLVLGPGLAACASAGPEGGVDASASGPGDALTLRDAALDAPGPPVTGCPSTDTCAAAVLLGTVSGDSGALKLTVTGHQAAWFRVRVTEDSSSALGLALRMAAKLTSPEGTNYDVFVYVNAGTDVVECTTPTGSMTTSGATEQTRVQWGEGAISNGSDDGRSVSIEIRPISGTCVAAAPWQLEVEGNWL
ncbi:MAG: hypothetical protein M3680_04575 [Myxococcota bacterium]|nr:hypothetical protein [Myxococcota bacterium]